MSLLEILEAHVAIQRRMPERLFVTCDLDIFLMYCALVEVIQIMTHSRSSSPSLRSFFAYFEVERSEIYDKTFE